MQKSSRNASNAKVQSSSRRSRQARCIVSRYSPGSTSTLPTPPRTLPLLPACIHIIRIHKHWTTRDKPHCRHRLRPLAPRTRLSNRSIILLPFHLVPKQALLVQRGPLERAADLRVQLRVEEIVVRVGEAEGRAEEGLGRWAVGGVAGRMDVSGMTKGGGWVGGLTL